MKAKILISTALAVMGILVLIGVFVFVDGKADDIKIDTISKIEVYQHGRLLHELNRENYVSTLAKINSVLKTVDTGSCNKCTSEDMATILEFSELSLVISLKDTIKLSSKLIGDKIVIHLKGNSIAIGGEEFDSYEVKIDEVRSLASLLQKHSMLNLNP
ncbi:hypothetical protein AV540_08090 [Brevibacillus parabrevis]|uniref:hypothetical protein n=1 Tax=Brevibacillus parabrevis TaxID=54914 RepID=UPI0007ABB756|nr:hypothetical protein [Brevibacillus parabrevis]KZE53010.1 hypothetical protein AV540_08090 [Brevibacillus parabrevis]